MTRLYSRLLLVLLATALVSCGPDNSDRFTDLGGGESPEGSYVAGVVRDTDGTPRAGAVVSLEQTVAGLPASVAERLTPSGRELRGGLAKVAQRATTSDADGRYLFDQVRAGSWRLEAQARDHLARIEDFEVSAMAAAVNETIVVDVALTPVGSYTGVVTIENATDHGGVLASVQGTSNVAVTDSAGNYRIDRVPLGNHVVRLHKEGVIHRDIAASLQLAGEVVDLGAVQLRLDANIAPTAEAGSPLLGVEGVPLSFGGSGSDLDGNVVLYEWDFEDDGVFDYADSTSSATTHVYATPGSYLAKLRVTDDDGAHGLDVTNVEVTSSRIYVSTTGNDSNPGTPQLPVATLQTALSLADSVNAPEIYVASGSYAMTGLVDLVDGVSIYGGRSVGSWIESPSSFSTFTGGGFVARGANLTSASVFRRLVIEQTSAPTVIQPSIALWLDQCSSSVRFEECIFTSSDARAGMAGFASANGISGSNGAPGQPGACDGPHGLGGAGGGSAIGCPGGAGGRGGLAGANPGQNGAPGGCAGGAGGPGGAGGSVGGNGFAGIPGSGGVSGGHGAAASGQGVVVGGMWQPVSSTAGTAGTNGRGGGGGGGGGGQSCTLCKTASGIDGGGNGGGGGGGGGQGSAGGGGGQGGWASFGAFANQSPVTFVDCTFNAGRGGNGGVGGSAGLSGVGGAGGLGAGACLAEIGRGGNGGPGGTGGRGGGGAGGSGGPSYGVCYTGAIPTFTNPTYNPSQGGTGAPGGQGSEPVSNAPSGSFGVTGNVLQR